MEEKTTQIPELRDLIAEGDTKALQEFCETSHPAYVAEVISELSAADAWMVIMHAGSTVRAEIFSNLDYDFQVDMVSLLQREELVRLLTDMPPDDRADLFKRLPEELQESVLPALAQAEREDIRRLAGYEEGTAGAVMTSDYATLSPDMTASEAIDHLRFVAPDKETIYYSYVVDENRKLIGFVSLRDLIVARRNIQIKHIMHKDIIFGRVYDDQEDVARKIQKYDLIALPVINGNDALVGIITHDDAIDIITQEHTEDMEKFMAIRGSHEAAVYMKKSAWEHFKNRSGWLLVLAMFGLISGYIVQSFEGMLLQIAILATFMPMLADTGGNTGSQAATLVVRALALKEVVPRDALKVLWKEFKVAFMVGLMLGAFAFGRVFLFSGTSSAPTEFSLMLIGLAVGLALAFQVLTATLIGAMLPLGAAKLNLDPAVVASPALTTIVDITGLLIFFTTVKVVLGM